MFFYRKDLIKSIGKVTSLFVLFPLFFLIYNIIYNRTMEPSQSLDKGAITTLITRLNAFTYELDVFFNYPIFGAGLFYFDSFWKELLGYLFGLRIQLSNKPKGHKDQYRYK